MPLRTVFILAVEDNAADYRLLQELISVDDGSTTLQFRLENVATIAQAIEVLSQDVFCDLILLDLNLPDNVGFGGLIRLKSIWPDTPVIMITGVADSDTFVESIRHGADEYIVKQEISRKRIIHALHMVLFRNNRLALLPDEKLPTDSSELMSKLAECRVKRHEYTELIRRERQAHPLPAG